MSVRNQNSEQVVTATTSETLTFTLPAGVLVRVEAGDQTSSFTVVVFLQLKRLAPKSIRLIPTLDSGALEYVVWDGSIRISDGWQIEAQFTNITSGDTVELSALVET